jgi:hypothetical protein
MRPTPAAFVSLGGKRWDRANRRRCLWGTKRTGKRRAMADHITRTCFTALRALGVRPRAGKGVPCSGRRRCRGRRLAHGLRRGVLVRRATRRGQGRAGQSTTRWPPPETASRSSALAHFQPTHTKWAGRQLGRPPRRRHDCSIVSGPKLGRADRNCRPSHAAPPALISRRRRQLSSCEPPLSAGPKLRPRAAPLGNPSVQNLSPSPSSFVPFPPLASGDSLSGLGLSQNRVSVASSLSAEAPRSAGPAMAAAETMQGGKSFFVFSVFCDCHLPVRAILCFGRRNWGDLRLLVS